MADAANTSVTWTNPNNAKVSDDSYATATSTGGTAFSRLEATNFGFAIDSTATINGILLEIEGKTSSVGGFYRGGLIKGGVADTANEGSLSGDLGAADAYKSRGGASNLQGNTWSPSDINSSTFGGYFTHTVPSDPETVSIDHIRITVTYTVAATAVSSPRRAFSPGLTQARALRSFVSGIPVVNPGYVEPLPGAHTVFKPTPQMLGPRKFRPTSHEPAVPIVITPGVASLVLSAFAPVLEFMPVPVYSTAVYPSTWASRWKSQRVPPNWQPPMRKPPNWKRPW